MVIGLNPIEVCALGFGIALAQDRYAEGFFVNGADPRGVIQVPGVLDVNEAKAMLRSWLSAHQGLNSAHLPAVLTEGAEFKPITISPADSQLLQSLAFSEERITGRIFRIPPSLLGMQSKITSFGKGIENMTKSFTDFTLAPYYAAGAEALTAITPPGEFVVFDVREFQAPTMLERAQVGSLGMLAGYFVPDDARKLMGLPPMRNGLGENPVMPINSQLLQQALDAIAAQQAGENEPIDEPSQNGNGSGQ
jgi:HK97 family phage portal protein